MRLSAVLENFTSIMRNLYIKVLGSNPAFVVYPLYQKKKVTSVLNHICQGRCRLDHLWKLQVMSSLTLLMTLLINGLQNSRVLVILMMTIIPTTFFTYRSSSMQLSNFFLQNIYMLASKPFLEPRFVISYRTGISSFARYGTVRAYLVVCQGCTTRYILYIYI